MTWVLTVDFAGEFDMHIKFVLDSLHLTTSSADHTPMLGTWNNKLDRNLRFL